MHVWKDYAVRGTQTRECSVVDKGSAQDGGTGMGEEVGNPSRHLYLFPGIPKGRDCHQDSGHHTAVLPAPPTPLSPCQGFRAMSPLALEDEKSVEWSRTLAEGQAQVRRATWRGSLPLWLRQRFGRGGQEKTRLGLTGTSASTAVFLLQPQSGSLSSPTPSGAVSHESLH